VSKNNMFNTMGFNGFL